MNGATSLVHSLLSAGVDVCFANPGTSEMHFVAALDQVPGMRCVLGLQENVVTGMADGYFRMARRPACTLLHCGPGLANGLANLHNARRARSGIVNVVGDQASFHRPHDAPLTADTTGLARSVSAWVHTSTQSAQLGRDAAAAVQAARAQQGQIATLILPADVSWNEGGEAASPLPDLRPEDIDCLRVEACARILRSHGPDCLVLLAGSALSPEGQGLAWRLARATGASLMADYMSARVSRGRGRLPLERVPYGMEAAIKSLARFRHIILVSAKPPVGFFAYPGMPSTQYPADARLHELSRPEQDAQTALQLLVDALAAPAQEMPATAPIPGPGQGAPSPEGLAVTVAALMPEHAIVSDESVSFGRGFYPHTQAAAPHEWLHLVGGAIGAGMPLATGAAIATAGQRRVINLQADGSAMYTLQALWTQAREHLPVTTILLNNGRYNILLGEYRNVGAQPGPTALGMLDLGNPALNWVDLARGMGVEGARATTLEQCADLMRASFGRTEPFLIELMI